MHSQSLSNVWLLRPPWTIASQASLSMGLLRQEYWSGLPFPAPGDLLDWGIEPMFPALAGSSFSDSCCSVTQSCPTLCNRMDCSMPSFPILHCLPELLKLMSTKSVMPSSHFILCHTLLLLPSIFPSIRVFSNESALCIRWPKYWSFSFSISPSNEYSELISSRID